MKCAFRSNDQLYESDCLLFSGRYPCSSLRSLTEVSYPSGPSLFQPCAPKTTSAVRLSMNRGRI